MTRTRIRLTLAALVVGLLVGSGINIAWAQGPLTPASNLRVRTDTNGYLLIAPATYTAADGPLTNFGNIRLRTDSNGYLLVAIPAGGSFSGQMLAPTGCTTIPYSFTGETTDGLCSAASNQINMKVNGSTAFESTVSYFGVNCLRMDVANGDARICRSATKTITADDGAAGSITNITIGDQRIDGSGFLRWGSNLGKMRSAVDGAFIFFNAAGSSSYEVRTIGTPTCSTNCGTSPTVTGSDSSTTVTMGATGVPASGFVLTFTGTWSAAPQCHVTMALAGMAVTKLPLTVVTTTTTATVVTNGAAPANGDKYHFQCSLGA